jgi:hypothetical protein
MVTVPVCGWTESVHQDTLQPALGIASKWRPGFFRD